MGPKIEVEESVSNLESQIHDLRNKLARLRAEVPRKPLQRQYLFKTLGRKTVRLEDLFGKHCELFLVHNMGESAPYCTMWADGFNGLLPHIENRCSFVVVSDDPPEVQKDFCESRGWNFRMVSSEGTSFKEEFGFQEGNSLLPGASTFYKNDQGQIFHCGSTFFGPGDPFCPVWYMFDMLPEGENNWRPKIRY